jgi:hypothetical protein
MRVQAIIVFAGALSTGGCSWVAVRRPPMGPIAPEPQLDCGSVAPVADAGAAMLLSFVVMPYVAFNISSCRDARGFDRWCLDSGDKAKVLAATAAIALPLALSAAHGYAATSDCRQVKQLQVDCVNGADSACLQLSERSSSPEASDDRPAEPIINP